MSVNSIGSTHNNRIGGNGGDYTVRRGDTLSAIARHHGVSLAALEAANPQIANFDLIFPHQHINLPSGGAVNGRASGGVRGIASAAGQPVSGPHANAAAVAEQYLGQGAGPLQRNASDNLPMRSGVETNICCANFVSAVLVEAGQLPANKQTTLVADLRNTLQAQGWTKVSASEARPGDVVIAQGHWPSGKVASHTVIVSGPGTTIGSNNPYKGAPQIVSHGRLSTMLSASNTTIWRAPAGVSGNASVMPTSSARSTGGVTPSGGGALSSRQTQAMQYFESQGWTHVQAAGLVANLTRESNLAVDAVGDGGRAYGLAQWHPDRQAKFAQFTGHSIRNSTFAEQLAFVNHELHTNEARAGRALAGATTAAEAGSIVSRLYERPGDVQGAANTRARLATQLA